MGELTSGHIFAGGGGDTEGAIAAGYKPIWGVENDKYAASVYRKRFPDVNLIEQDIQDIPDEFILTLPTPDITIWGSPCPDFSVAGKRAGIDGTRGKLFFEGLRFIRVQLPPAFLFENVDGLLSADKGATFPKVIQAFTDLGYCCTWQLRNGNRHVPQNRERIFIVGYHRGSEGDRAQARKEVFTGIA
ncbi:DNA cytosine methyltransferase [Nostoc piscinale]|uniref:DNA cytosine methyltransferase n=1 Tax=Nostoc piscinale TaxID=224012 RepID=UPI000780D8C6|nr:DNA (cytosine-5-)-methyltransferase [Nostoc piscinale]